MEKRGQKSLFLFILSVVFLMLLIPVSISGDESKAEVVKIWDDEIPFKSKWKNAPVPTLTCYPAPLNETGAAVVICPGGGYLTLAMDREGDLVAKAFNEVGISAYVLRYRLGGEGNKHPAMIADIQQAIALLREKAPLWGIDPGKVGVVGFSAGGHLAATASTYEGENYSLRLNQAGEKYNVRPNFAILGYPVITLDKQWTHYGSKFQLLGANPPPHLVSLLSCEKHVKEDTPPVFLVHAEDDIVVPIENSYMFYRKLEESHVPVELYVYKRGGHSFSVKKREWFNRAIRWLSDIQIL